MNRQHEDQQHGGSQRFPYQHYSSFPVQHDENASAVRSNAQSTLITNVSGPEQGYAQSIHRPTYTGHSQFIVPTTTDSRIDSRPAPQLQQAAYKPQKKRRRNQNEAGASASARPRAITTTTIYADGIEVPASAVIDRVPSGKERRRTQMRMAQRAYRQRKQNELSSREKQLSERDDIIAQMKNAFGTLSSRLTDSDLLSSNPDLTQPIQDMARAFEALSQIATSNAASSPTHLPDSSRRAEDEQGTDSIPPGSGGLSDVAGEFHYRQQQQPQQISQQPQQLWTGTNFASDSADGHLGVTNQTAPYMIGPSPTINLHDIPNPLQQYTDGIGNNNTNRNRFISSTTMSPMALPIPAYINAPTSYSFQETTFARRLMRICMERGHRVLVSGGSPTLSPKESRVFRLAYRVWSREHLIDKFQASLAGDTELYDPSIPFLPVGGAGTHYLPAINSPSSSSSLSSSSFRSVPQQQHQRPLTMQAQVTSGPLTTHTAHVRHNGPDTSVNGIISSLGLLNDGDWFDSNDIDGYLREMGICLEPHSSYHRFLIPSNPTVASKNLNATTMNPHYGTDMQEYVPAYVDVDTFVESLVTKAMCLGRAPGFRKSEVEELFYNCIES